MTELDMLNWCIAILESDKIASIGVTVLVDGTFISGDMVPRYTYYKGIAEKLESASREETNVAYVLGEVLKGAIDEVKTKEPQRNQIFLKNPVIWDSPDDPTSATGNLLALRVGAINGFMWGKRKT